MCVQCPFIVHGMIVSLHAHAYMSEKTHYVKLDDVVDDV
jgi:hypothetical protein